MLARAIQQAMGGDIYPPNLAQYGRAVVFDPQDLRTLYQDAAGTTPVTGVEQPVGLMLDKGQGLELGHELVTNGKFDTDAAWLKGIGWTISGGVAAYDGTDGTNAISQSTAVLQTGVFYRVSISVSLTQGALLVRPSAGGAAGQFSVYSTGTYNLVLQGLDGNIGCIAGNSGGRFVGSIDNISVRELKGFHATQSTAGSRPTLSGSITQPYFAFDGSADFMATALGGKSTAAFYYCASIKIGKVGSAQTLISDTGTNTGYRVRINASNQLEFSAGNGSAYTTVSTAGTALALNDTVVLSAWHDGANLNAQINDGTIYQVAFSTATAGTDALTIGKDNNASSSYFQGNLYGLFNSGPVPNINMRNALKRHYAAKAGIKLWPRNT